MAQLFTPGADALARALPPVGGVLTVVVGVTWWIVTELSDFASGTEVAAPQPVPFRHAHHAGELGLACSTCHPTATKSARAGMPGAAICMRCHTTIWSTADVLEPVRDSWASGQPIRWARVYRIADFACFDHSVHLAGGLACRSCHGDLASESATRPAARVQMTWCLGCHERAYGRPGATPPALTDCTECHR